MKLKSFMRGLATGAVLGAAVGVATGLLTAPKSGKELQSDLKDYAKDMRKDLNKMLKNAEKVTREFYNNAVDQVTEMYSKIKEFKQEDLMEMRDRLLAEWKDVQKKFSRKQE